MRSVQSDELPIQRLKAHDQIGARLAAGLVSVTPSTQPRI
ncbi:hypothetical protein PAMC26577_31815 [Caballeronia sordidicola]|uniref:Uncharacterized protein n=1 Tax=Caballeronia sordidicola TaxID=196367 RepID=A0A242MCQ9_CABSO|nr:hypothetical protein PAMC26577_31815 [Caballeronia sordidicola]